MQKNPYMQFCAKTRASPNWTRSGHHKLPVAQQGALLGKLYRSANRKGAAVRYRGTFWRMDDSKPYSIRDEGVQNVSVPFVVEYLRNNFTPDQLKEADMRIFTDHVGYRADMVITLISKEYHYYYRDNRDNLKDLIRRLKFGED